MSALFEALFALCGECLVWFVEERYGARGCLILFGVAALIVLAIVLLIWWNP